MHTKSSAGLVGSLLKQLKRLAFTLTEKPSTAVEEYTLEHFLLYHGLVGSTPDDQPEFRDVRADLSQAFDQRSPANLAIALKLPPLWWEDKLQSVFAELGTKDRQLLLEMLLPAEREGEELPPSQNPLKMENWQVRANAANMLCFLQAKEAAPRMVESLDETKVGDLKAAFCHIAFALGRLGTEPARLALAKYLYDEEPWFRVDAARSLACWPLDAVDGDLAKALLSHHNLSDYTAIAVARKHSPLAFMHSPERLCREAALEMIIEIVNAGSQTYPPEIVFETGSHLCWPYLYAGISAERTARGIRATLSLAEYFRQNSATLAERLSTAKTEGVERLADGELPQLTADELVAQAEEAVASLSAGSLADALLKRLEDFDPAHPVEADDNRHTVWLLGRLGITASTPRLVGLLKEQLAYTDDVIDAIGLLGDPQAAEQLVELGRKTVDLDERRARPPSAQPVEEGDPSAARHYWSILKALGHLPHSKGLELLLEATEDFAPDKRQQALQSLVSVCRQDKKNSTDPRVHECIARGLSDSSTQVRLAALDGVSQLRYMDLTAKVLKLFDSKAVSVSRKALTVMSELADSGQKAEVAAQIESKIKSEFDHYKKERLQQFLDGLA